jgi:hypothetical protein
MIAPEAGCDAIIASSSLSAGGQVEQPSAVKSSTSTGTGWSDEGGRVLVVPADPMSNRSVAMMRIGYQATLTPRRTTRGATTALIWLAVAAFCVRWSACTVLPFMMLKTSSAGTSRAVPMNTGRST